MKVSTVKKFNFAGSVTVFSVVLVVGIIFLSLFLNYGQIEMPDNYVETRATITGIEEEYLFDNQLTSNRNSPENIQYHVYVEFSQNGKTYENLEYGMYDSSMKEGDTVTIYVNPDNPEEYFSSQSEGIVFTVIGFVIIAIGAAGIISSVNKLKKGRK